MIVQPTRRHFGPALEQLKKHLIGPLRRIGLMPRLQLTSTNDPMVTDIDLAMMRRAIELAGQAAALEEVPVGAVVYKGNQIIAEAIKTISRFSQVAVWATAMIDLIKLLDAVKETGSNRWLARCPAHDDRRPSLSVTQTDDGIWLYKCWAGCEQLAVVDALGIEFADLFPERRIRHIDHRLRLSAIDALAALGHEATVVAVIASDFLVHKAIDAETWSRLALAVSRIGLADAACCTRARS